MIDQMKHLPAGLYRQVYLAAHDEQGAGVDLTISDQGRCNALIPASDREYGRLPFLAYIHVLQ